MAQKLRLGIIGLGAQGSMYAKFIEHGMVPNMEIGAICDTDPAKAAAAESAYPGVPFYDDYIAHAGQRRRGRRRHLRAALPAPGDGHRTPSSAASTRSSRSRPASTPSRSRSSTTFAATKPELTFAHHVQPAQQPALPQDQGDRRQRRDRRHPAHQLDHHHLVAAAGLLRPERLARHLGRRGRRRPGQPGTPPAGPVAVDLRRPAVRLRQGRLRVPPRHRRRGRGDRGRGLRRRRHRASSSPPPTTSSAPTGSRSSATAARSSSRTARPPPSPG